MQNSGEVNRLEPLLSLLERTTLRIAHGDSSGTGFFVAPSLLLTCAHVVEQAYHDGNAVTVHWEERVYSASVVRTAPDPYPDLALLRVESIPSTHPCVFFEREMSLGDVLYCYGYPKMYPLGDPASFTFEGTTGGSSSLLKFKGGEVRPGFSGSPLLNKRTGGVCGVTKLTRGEHTLLGGRGVPIEAVFTHFPEVGEAQKSFHQHDSRWYAFLSEQQRTLLGLEAQHTPARTLEVYYSFAKEDEYLARQLQKHLSLLKRRGFITEWYPGEVALGKSPSAINRQHLGTAHIILLLISPDFIFEKDSESPDNFEIGMAMQRSQQGAIVIPILLRPVGNLDLALFGDLVFLPRNKKPIIAWSDHDTAFTEIAQEIREVVERVRKHDRS